MDNVALLEDVRIAALLPDLGIVRVIPQELLAEAKLSDDAADAIASSNPIVHRHRPPPAAPGRYSNSTSTSAGRRALGRLPFSIRSQASMSGSSFRWVRIRLRIQASLSPSSCLGSANFFSSRASAGGLPLSTSAVMVVGVKPSSGWQCSSQNFTTSGGAGRTWALAWIRAMSRSSSVRNTLSAAREAKAFWALGARFRPRASIGGWRRRRAPRRCGRREDWDHRGIRDDVDRIAGADVGAPVGLHGRPGARREGIARGHRGGRYRTG